MAKKLEDVLVPVSEQPYSIPSNWCWTYQNVVCKLGNGEKREHEEFPYLEVKYLRGKVDAEIKSAGNYIEKNTKVILVDGENSGEVFSVPRSGYMGSTFKALNISKYVNEEYLLYFVASKKDLLRNNKTGSAIPHLNKKLFFDLKFPLPPLDEQQRIVNQINSLFVRLDKCKEIAQEIIDGYRDKKEAILAAALSGKLIKKGDDIQETKIAFFLEDKKDAIKAGPFGSALKKEVYVENGYKVYGQEQVISGNESIGNYYVDETKYNELSSCRIAPGDILISLVGTVGKVLILSDDCKPGIINPRLIKISLDRKKMLPMFFKYYFESEYLRALYKEESHGTTMDVLNMKIIKSLPFPIFSIQEQEEIVRILDNTLGNLEDSYNIAEETVNQIELIKKSILLKAFKGELGTQNILDEPAGDLLKKILLEIPAEKKKTLTKKVRMENDMRKDMLETLKENKKITAELLKQKTGLEIDAFYEELKKLIESGKVKEIRESGIVYLEAIDED